MRVRVTVRARARVRVRVRVRVRFTARVRARARGRATVRVSVRVRARVRAVPYSRLKHKSAHEPELVHATPISSPILAYHQIENQRQTSPPTSPLLLPTSPRGVDTRSHTN